MIYIPKKINVGFQNRSGTYTGKLAYVIYYDERGKLRKEASWNGWRDESIPNEEYDNTPTEGFVLNKKVGGVEESWGWDPRRTYTRIYDPRGYEFEITIPNLLWILENCNCIKGKGLEGEFVYGWDGKELLLIPVSAPEYKEYINSSEIRNNATYIKAKELVIGKTYKTLGGEEYVYLGKFDCYKYNYSSYSYYRNKIRPIDEINDDEIPWQDEPDYLRNREHIDHRNKCQIINAGKHHYFMCLNKISTWRTKPELWVTKNISRKFVSCYDNIHEEYIDFVSVMEHSCMYSPIDLTHVDTVKISIKEFVKSLDDLIGLNSFFYKYFLKGDESNSVEIYWRNNSKEFILYERGKKSLYFSIEDIHKIYNQINPVYKIFYLQNGNEYKRRFYNGEY